MSTAQQPAFWVGHTPIFGDLILSPMDGYSDLPFRSLARQLGSAMSYTEFVNAMDVVQRFHYTERRLTYTEDEHPVVFQLFDDDPQRILQAALKVRKLEPDIIDVNMGCPAKSVSNRGAGSGLLRTPEKVAEIFSLLTAELDIPITGKIRLGWDEDSLNYLDIARIIEDNGGAMLAVHGRTKQQAYKGTANWDAIAEVKQTVSIPVIGNGDVRTVTDIQRIKDHTGCDGVMIARAAIGNPWIFARQDRHEVTDEQVRAMMLQHLELMLDFYGPEKGLIFFRKHTTRYISPYRFNKEQRQKLMTREKPEEFLELLDEIVLTQHAVI
ncbi:MAG: tRNA dihydrouridine synthase DusB [Chloroflexi bacterium]|nr:MAG: tRNA dihydrouridine synthase DusB [Chloroflexota bacterium]MBL1194252.1 tRNA dihydrouridine synthase DusB [Chloroflexota bacterium]NOH11545.1 tRNA dihydrouridine synthase DusB [Chloroflexota bacterium]